MSVQKASLLVLVIIISISAFSYAWDLYWSTPVEVTTDPSAPGARTFTATIGLIGGPVENLWVVGKIDGTQVFQKTIASIHTGGTKEITFNHTVGIGNHNVQIIIDPSNATTDENTGNNTTQKNFSFFLIKRDVPRQLPPDLSVTSITTNVTTIGENQDYTVSIVYKNSGLVKIEKGMNHHLKVNGEVVYGWWFDLNLEPGETRSLTRTLNSGSSGEKVISIHLDANNVLVEKNENNNVKSTTLTVVGTKKEIQ